MTACDLQLQSILLIPKKDKHRPSTLEHRPISIMPALPKLYHMVIKERMQPRAIQYLNRCANQFAMPSKDGAFLLREATKHMTESKQNIVIQFDFAKAFDSVPHKVLIAKICQLFGRSLARTIYGILTQTKSNLILEGYTPTVHHRQGIPQGSTLSPLLFLVFITERVEGIPRLLLYMDDVNILTTKSHQDDMVKRFEQWTSTKGMKINWKKSCVVTETPRTTSKLRETDHGYVCGGCFFHRASSPCAKTQQLLHVSTVTIIEISHKCISPNLRARTPTSTINCTQ